jgi:hypothetical protein
MTEKWKPTPGFESRYEVSNLAKVRRIDVKPFKMMSVSRDALGYGRVQLSLNGKTKRFIVHRLVLAAFIGPCPPNMEGAHLDGNPSNNRLDNLKWCTSTENHWHKRAHGTHLCGNKMSWSKIKSDNDVRKIRKMREGGMKIADIAKIYGVTFQMISLICRRKNWTHVT